MTNNNTETNTDGIFELEPGEIEDNSNRVRALLGGIRRPGMRELIAYLNTSGYFIGPASTKYHGSYIGGLVRHNLNVFELFVGGVHEVEQCKNISKESVIICSLLHDLCKIGAYVPVKVGRCNESNGYEYNKSHPKGHSNLSIKIIEKFIKLTDLEKQIIKYHMGYYGTYEFSQKRGEYSLAELSKANENPLTKLFHWCDDMETQFYIMNNLELIKKEDTNSEIPISVETNRVANLMVQARCDERNNIVSIIEDDLKIEANGAVKFVLESLKKEINGLGETDKVVTK